MALVKGCHFGVMGLTLFIATDAYCEPVASAREPVSDDVPAQPTPVSPTDNTTVTPAPEPLAPNSVGDLSDRDVVLFPSDVAPGTHVEWYGFWGIAIDAVSFALPIIAYSSDNRTLNGSGVPLAVGGMGYALGAPIVHLVHGEMWRAGASFGLRVLSPVVHGAVFYALTPCSNSADGWCQLGRGVGAVFAGAAGALVASIVDASVFAFRRVPDESAQAWHVLPNVAVSRQAVVLGVNGSF
jgi:hypothetical protein